MNAHMATSDQSAKPSPAVNARCPHIVFHDLLGAPAVAALLRHVEDNEHKFVPAPVRRRGVQGLGRDDAQRKCTLLSDLGEFRQPIETFVRAIAPQALEQLGLIEPHVVPKEFQISAHGDGGHFVPHLDTVDELDRVRILSCVYYFAKSPPRFSGGELRLHGFPTMAGTAPPPVDVAPHTDTLVAFPSWLTHEVRPVRVPSGAFADSRFAIYCWLHRADAA